MGNFNMEDMQAFVFRLKIEAQFQARFVLKAFLFWIPQNLADSHCSGCAVSLSFYKLTSQSACTISDIRSSFTYLYT